MADDENQDEPTPEAAGPESAGESAEPPASDSKAEEGASTDDGSDAEAAGDDAPDAAADAGDGTPPSDDGDGGAGSPPPRDGDTKAAAWGRPLVRLDTAWTALEARLCAGVLVLEVLSLSLWVALKGLSSPPDSGSPAGVVFRGLTGALILGMVGYFAPAKKSIAVRRTASLVGVFLGVVLAKSWANVGVSYGSNILNWYQQASTLTLLGGLRGVGTRLTLWLALLGGSLATAAGKHITIDLITRFLKPKARLPVVVIGWVGAAVICTSAAWGFFDHIAIENFGANADVSAGAKVGAVAKGLDEDFFVLRKQISLDFKTLPHVIKGQAYSDWLTGAEWNKWLDSSGFNERYGKESTDSIKVPPDDKRSPIVLIPGKGDVRGELINAANLVFPFGLFIIAIRFILLSLLAVSGHKPIDEGGEGMDIQRPAEEAVAEGEGG